MYEIKSLDHYGKGITFVNDKITFVKNALPNEQVEIELTKESKKFNEGVVKKYIKKSLTRISPECPYYTICGGCNIMHMDYNEQLSFKENKVKEILKKFSNITDSINPIIGTSHINYRNKITLQVNSNLGLYKENSYEIVPIENCLISDNNINKIINLLSKLNLTNISQIIIRATLANEIMVILVVNNKIDEDYFINNLNKICTSLIKKEKNNYTTLYGKDYIVEEINNFKFKISPEAFFQVNTKGAFIMYEIVKKYAGNGDTLLDLYCGTGSFGIYLSNNFKKVIGIEINEYAKDDAEENALLNNINNIEFICGDANKKIDKLKDIDTIIIDPPRSGLERVGIENILNIKPQKIIYVACDPISLARDINALKESYNVIEITPLDMFPNTYHVECICLLELI